MDLDALQREIGSGTTNGTATADTEPDFEDDYVDPYAAYLDDDEDAPRR
jgi:hypothetical protein